MTGTNAHAPHPRRSRAFALAAIAACGGTTDASLQAARSRLEACQASAKALCARAAACSELYIRFFFETVADCEAMVGDACVARYDGSGASRAPRACEAEAASAACEDLTEPQRAVLFSTPQDALLHACPVTPGSFDDHAACIHDGDCKSGECGELRPGGGNGCWPRHRLGEACQENEEILCEAPTRCVGGRCTPLAATGAECADASACATGSCVAGRCAPLLGAGAACDTTRPPGGCDLPHGLVCGDDGLCRAITIVGPGEACGPLHLDIPKSTAHLCDARARCSDDGTCVSAPRRGDPCTDTCRRGLTCQSGQCVTATR
jgi:hypothetical protein